MRRYASVVILAVVVGAALGVIVLAPGKESPLVFAAETGEQRDYHVLTHVSQPQQGRTRAGSDGAVAHSLMSYEVTEGGTSPALELVPRFLEITDPGERLRVSSATREGSDGEYRDLVQAAVEPGFRVSSPAGDADATGAVANADKQWQALTEQSSGVVATLLEHQFAPQLPLNGLEPEVGAETTLDGWHGLDRLHASVRGVWPDAVMLSLEGQSDEKNVFGTAVVERDGGWIESLALAFETRVSRPGGDDVPALGALLMLPGESRLGPILWSLLDAPDSRDTYILVGELMLSGRSDADAVTADRVFPGHEPLDLTDPGGFASFTEGVLDGNIFVMSLIHDAPGLWTTGDIRTEDVRIFDADGAPAATDVHVIRPTTTQKTPERYEDYTDPDAYTQSRTGFGVVPVGWGDDHEIDRIEVDAAFAAADTEVVALPLDPAGVTERTVEGAVLRAEPVARDTFEVRVRTAPDASYHIDLPGLESTMVSFYPPHPDAPDWLDPIQRGVISVPEGGFDDNARLRLRFPGQRPPAELEIDVFRFAEEPTYRHTVIIENG